MTTLELTSNHADARRIDRLVQWTRVLCVLFFFSGFPALIYQLTWQRALFRIFGVNIESVTIVVTAFMLGLGLGSLAGGWLSKRRGIPLLPLLGGIELMTGAFGLVSLKIFDRVSAFTAGLPLPATAAVSLALVIVPTLLMGATLPVLVGHLVRRSGHVGSALGLLYYVNTLGAGAACFACAAFLFPFVGMQGAVYAAVGINAAVAAGAFVAYWRDRRDPTIAIADTPAASVARQPLLGLGPALALAGAGGFVSLSYEIFFFRTVSYATGSSATAFALTLGAFLIGLASGSRQAGRNCAALPPERAIRRAVTTLMSASVLGFLFLPLLDHLVWLGSGIVGVAFLLVYLVARFWGSLLPYLAEFGVAADDRAGMRTALLYLANILGSAAGSIVTGFVLTDRLSLVAIAAALVVASLACVVMLAGTLPLPRSEKLLRASLAAGLALLALVLIPRGSANVLADLQWKGAPQALSLVDIVENRSGIITVAADGTVFGNGMYDGRFNTDLKHDTNGIVRPYALSLFHPAPRDVLMIGLSSGSWAQVIANNPDVASLTVVEINPGYVTLIAKTPEVASLLTNPKVAIVTDDGRRWLRANPGRRFDAIVSNTNWHFRANVTNLLSAEFLDLVKSHLNPRGVFFYNATESDRVQRTGCLAFANGARFLNHMVVSATPIRWDFVRWRRILASYRIDGRPVFDISRSEDRAELDRLQASLAAANAPRPIEACADILARTAGEQPVTDDNMGSEWRYSLGLE
ncbi:MAG: fused MFS/spermidine synthase [Xanthobacteraceae bacterium]|jgi:spermidine synthase/predicted MFS family arabinose efflux permease